VGCTLDVHRQALWYKVKDRGFSGTFKKSLGQPAPRFCRTISASRAR
jgi:hypothetical protein